MSQNIVDVWDGVQNTNSWVHDGDVERSAVDIVELASSVAGYSAGAQAAAAAASGYADTASGAVASIGTAATDAVQAVQNEGTAQISALVDAGGVQTGLIGSAGAAQLADIVTSGGIQISSVGNAGAAQITAITSAGGAQVALVSAAGTSATGDLAAVTAAQSAALVSAGGYQSGLIATAGSAQIAAVQTEGGTQIAAVQLAASAQVSSATVAAMSAGAAASTAQGAASAASGYAVSAGSFVSVTSGYATSAGSAASVASGYALTASSYMTSAGGYASAASDSADNAADSATAAQASADSIAASAAQIQTNADNITALETKTDITNKNVANIQALLNGTLYREETDSTAAYSKVVPTRAMPYASVDMISGKTVVWNQLVDADTISVTLTAEHKYYAEISGTASIMTGAGTAQAVTGGTDIVIDLTQMFGAGNEPSSVAEFEAMFPSINPAYNAGALMSAGVTEIESKGKNLCDLDAVWSGISSAVKDANGVWVLASLSSITNIKLWENDGTYQGQISYSYQRKDSNGRAAGYRIQVVYEDNTTAVAGSNAFQADWVDISATTASGKKVAYLRGLYNSNQTCYIKDVLIEKSATATEYTPYFSRTLPIPSAIQSLPGYGWSAGTAYNYIDFDRKVYVQNVGSVDLGSLSRSFNAIYASWQIVPPSDILIPTVQQQANNYLSEKYTQTPQGNLANIQNNQYIMGTSGALWVKTDGTNTVPPSGLFYYSLATPIETDISSLLTDSMIEVEPEGSLTFKNQNGDNWRVPVPNSETFLVQATPELPTTDGTYTLQCTVTDGTPSVTWVTA